jgi:hypothetical protein
MALVCYCAAFILPPAEQIQLWQQHITKHELFTTGHLLLLLLFIWPDCAAPHVMPRCPFSFFSIAFSPRAARHNGRTQIVANDCAA